ncbi:MAG: hypothetical protein J2P18_14330 [Nocardia sp.]|nr:hypothetical protein [Nocardia sp.]
MGSVTKATGGLAAALLIQAGLTAAPSAANAQQAVFVPCTADRAAALNTAITNANTARAGTIRLASFCDYSLTAPFSPTGTGRGPDGFLINARINIIGGRSTTISRAASASKFRVLEVAPGAALFLRNVFISGGDAATSPIPGVDTGGGILSSRGNVQLDHVTVTGNTADSGGGISNDSGRFIVVETLISRNTSRGGGGGGIYNDGSLSVKLSRITGNHANTNGGGVFNEFGRIEAFRTTIDRNTANANGGGLYNNSTGRAVLTLVLTEANSAASGGGIFNAGITSRVTSIDSLIRANTPNNCAPPGSVLRCTG